MNDLPAPTDHRWLSVHVFYASNANPMLVECFRPLVDRLRGAGLISRCFFIKYWMEGPHVRLRLLPSDGVEPGRVRAEVDAAIEGFLRRRPALYEVDDDGLGDLYKRMFLAEYGEQRWDEEYGPDGTMPMRPNNSYAYISYEREYGRYGGLAGVELAEWHFESSSDIVLELLTSTNVHVRPVMLGLGVQLMTTMCAVFLEDESRIAAFLDDYRRFWETSYEEPGEDNQEGFQTSYRRMAVTLRDRLADLRRSARQPAGHPVGSVEGRWLAHCRELRDRVAELAGEGKLVFQRGQATTTTVADVDTALPVLLSSYVHMTNNRLGVSILDEIYLSYLIRTAFVDELAEVDGLAGVGA